MAGAGCRGWTEAVNFHRPDDRHDASPEAALAALASAKDPVLVDLDETLYLRNSTEDFIDCARPALLAYLLLRLLDLLAPWRLTGGEPTRDNWRIGVIRSLFPWTHLLWRQRVGHLAAIHGNRPLVEALKRGSALPVVLTVGFRPVVTPLVAALGLGEGRIVAVEVWRPEDRRAGKLALATRALGMTAVARSLVVTDSLQDLPLLDACRRPFRVLWPGAHYRPALSGLYLPGRYLSQVKRPGAHYIRRSILQDELPLWVFASIGLAAAPAAHLLGLILLLVSFWAIYEQGYVENDIIADRYETDPQLSVAYRQIRPATSRIAPWVWAAGSGALGIGFLAFPAAPGPGLFAAWGAVLLATRGLFWVYNRLDKATRVWLFPGLQLLRTASFAAVVPIVPAAPAFLGAHVLAKWVPYFAYRQKAAGWPETPVHLVRLVFAAVLAAILAFAAGAGILATPASVALSAFLLFKARRELRTIVAGAVRLDRGSKEVGARQ